MKISYDLPNGSDYINLRINSGMGSKKSIERVETAIKNSLFIISLYDDKKLIGMGRIIGDNGISYAVTDIMVDKEYQGKGYGKLIMKEIDNYFSENTDEDCYIILIANLPADNLYSKFSFEYLPNSKCGMLRKQNK
ncbi:GNAT family N-acetyltransferase [Fusobacterium pseudoperiodonticum]|nr:GNAT family N-acetyltransferase [Fusobacterium pseudoperiodonticum]